MGDPKYSSDVVICECFCRDGLQHEEQTIPTASKLSIVTKLYDIGFKRIEVTSYSNPKVIPQFHDASELLCELNKRVDITLNGGIFFKATCPNDKAVERALRDVERGCGANELSFLVSASESHSLKNLKKTRLEQWANVKAMALLAGDKFRLIGTVSVAFGCPFEGAVSPDVVLQDVLLFRELGIRHIAIGDTTGMATPNTVKHLFALLREAAPDVNFIAHFHDSRGTALLNCLAAYEVGVRYFDSAIGGVGGHPKQIQYGGGYTGNACTEDLVGLFESCGVRTNIDLTGLMEVSQYCEQVLGRGLHSYVAKSGWNPLMATFRE